MTVRDPRQLDLFANAGGEGLAQRATQKRRSKQALPAQVPVHETTAAGQRPGRDETTVLRFPTSVWAPRLWQGKVEKVTLQLLSRKTELGRQNLWSASCRTLFAQMRRRGATMEEIERQIIDFHAAVSWQLSNQKSGPGAA